MKSTLSLTLCILFFKINFAQCNLYKNNIYNEIKNNNIHNVNLLIRSLNTCCEKKLDCIKNELPEAFEYINEFEGGLTTAKLLDGKFCVINTKLEIVRKLEYDFAGKIVSGVIAVSGNNFIDVYDNKLDTKLVYDIYLREANGGNLLAMNNLSSFYLRGDVVEKNIDNYFYWLAKAATNEFPLAMYRMGNHYFYGYEPVKKDIEKAYYWYKKSADKNFIESLELLGEMYFFGIYLEKNYAKAVECYEKVLTISDENIGAINNLGNIYSEGNFGVNKNENRALEYYKQGYLLKDAVATYNLANINLGHDFYVTVNGDLYSRVDLLKEALNLDKSGQIHFLVAKGALRQFYLNNNALPRSFYLLKSANLGYYEAKKELCANYIKYDITEEKGKEYCNFDNK